MQQRSSDQRLQQLWRLIASSKQQGYQRLAAKEVQRPAFPSESRPSFLYSSSHSSSSSSNSNSYSYSYSINQTSPHSTRLA